MASPRALAMKDWKQATQIESALRTLMSAQAFPLYEQIEHLVKQLRIACEATIFRDFEYAITQDVEQKLWDSHVLINTRYRKMLEGYRKPEKKHLVVERRKLEKHYVDFIKTSQFFYKGYIQRLACHFGGMPGLRRVAHRMSLDLLSADTVVYVKPELEDQVETSCHSSLLRLGDLSRYRNQVRTKDRSWDPALGYYALANSLCPDKGSAHNQMAVVALADSNHLDAVYHFFRAFAVKESHELAQGNLNLEFKKVITAWKQKRPQGKTDSMSVLVWWFVLLHARFYEGQEFSTRKEMEKEVLSRMTMLLKEQSFDDVLEKIVIINMAAEAFAAQRFAEQSARQDANSGPEVLNSYHFTLEFNVRTLLVLLQALSAELDQDHRGEELPQGSGGASSTTSREKVTVVARRILPVLRQYGTWLAIKAKIILYLANIPAIKAYGQDLWNMYASVLTKLTNLFPVAELPAVEYLLEEDENTIGFRPLRDAELSPECDLFTDDKGNSKERITEGRIDRQHPTVEMQARIRDIVLTAASLEARKMIPISCYQAGNGQHVFSYVQDGIVASPQSSTNADSQVTRTISSRKTTGWSHVDGHHTSATESMEDDMSRMVDDLVEPRASAAAVVDETSYGMHSQTANEIFAALPSNGHEPRQHSTPKMLPNLTGLYGSAFTPTQNELQATSPLLSTKQGRLAAAQALDHMTGYTSRPSPWRTNPSSPLSGSQQPVNQVLQQSLQQQYTPYSSNFADSSSLYGNTTHFRNQLSTGSAKRGPFPAPNGNSTIYPGASDFDRTAMLQSSLWNGTQADGRMRYVQTPPGGQGG